MGNAINLLSKLTFSRATNILKLHWSYYYSKVTGKNHHLGLPMALAFEPTTSCNLRCPECPSGLRSFTRPTGMGDVSLLEKVLEEQQKTLMYLTLYFQGEPYLNAQFFEMIHAAKKRNVYSATSTNAHFLDDENARKTIESGLDKLIISIDGTTQETYEQYRVGGELEKVIEGTKNIVHWKKKLKSSTPQIVFQFLVVKPNEHQIEEVKQLGKELGVDKVSFKSAQIYDYENDTDLIPTREKYSRYKKDQQGKNIPKHELDNSCWKMWHSSVITWDGKVVPCCFDKDAEHAFGAIADVPFSEVWKSQPYQDFRQALLKSRSEIDICKNCSEGAKVWV